MLTTYIQPINICIFWYNIISNIITMQYNDESQTMISQVVQVAQ